jgi:AcrR family transcriptional regulator
MTAAARKVDLSEFAAFWGLVGVTHTEPGAVSESQRRRLMMGMVHAVASKGYAAATVADAISAVRVSRRTFYELFKDKEDCFLAAYELAHEALVGNIVAAQRGLDGPLARLSAAHAAYLRYFAKHPDLARAFITAARAAGERVARRQAEAQREFVQMHRSMFKSCRRKFPDLPELPDLVLSGIVGGANRIIADAIETDGGRALEKELPSVLYLTLSAYGLHAQARAVLGGDLSVMSR